jgi:Na+/H+-translocating membrane pyrophosphatase
VVIDFGLVSVGIAIVAILYAIYLIFFLTKQDPGNEKMKEIAEAVKDHRKTKNPVCV